MRDEKSFEKDFLASPFGRGFLWLKKGNVRKLLLFPYCFVGALFAILAGVLVVFGNLLQDTGFDLLSLFDKSLENPDFPELEKE